MKITATLLLILVVATGNAQKTTQPDFTKVRAIINDAIDNHQLPSATITVVKDGKIIWEEGFGYADRENKRKATPHTPYASASITKTMTATALMKMQEQKLINIDSPVNKYLKGANLSSFKWDAGKATVRMIMSHTSGLTTFNFWCRTDSLTCLQMDDEVYRRYAVLVAPPGKEFDYSNLGYGVLDHVIRDVSGRSYAEYMKQEVFEPLGMKNTFVADGPLPAGRAIRYAGGDAVQRMEFPYSHSYQAGASLAYTSAHDLALFAMLHLNDLKRKNALISPKSVNAMQDTVARNGSDHYGLGWWISDDYYGYKSHLAQGGTFVAQAWMRLIPSEDMAVIVLANIGHGEPWSTVIKETFAELLPKFKKNVIATDALAKKENTRVPVPEPPASKWQGVVKTYKGDIPVAFNFSGLTSSSADLGTRHIDLSKVKVKLNWYSYTIEGDLGLEDVGRSPYNMHFYLTQDGDQLYGSVQTSSSGHPDTPRLSFWVEMTRVE
jgi:CubicO group peptidase (beta-lactamase class C family)